MGKSYSVTFIKAAHKATIFHEKEVLASSSCTCFYCGHQFDPQQEEHLYWTDLSHPQSKTLVCPMCGIDCIIGSASGFPITDPEFIMACTEQWFGGISRISDGLAVEKVRQWHITVE
ncbi:hypothetical protein [Sphaerochaeta sp. PS]|uniref:hypothetical protein n=1 Tax=Sphaerochaeta sp. PS TaxID=3076336 RepID=UPI0028A2F06E|nr:hypothetical protein [Sphaerochaeta sp. PS]MDT4761635.1 hypothetical protein [Sphaerochaeta sp. PS]